MKFDDAVKYACNEEIQESDLSPEKAEEMLNFIENKVIAHKSSLGYRISSKFKAMVFSSPVATFVQVAGFILLLVVIPIITKSIIRSNALHSRNPKPQLKDTVPAAPTLPEKTADIEKTVTGPNDVGAADFENINAISEKGNVFLIEDPLNPSQTGKVYNTDKLDEFIKSFNNGVKANIFIAKYAAQGDKIWVNSLTKLESTGSTDSPLLVTGYDVYSSKEIFTGDKPIVFKKISKSTKTSGIRYAAYTDKNEALDMGMTLLSFNVSAFAAPITAKEEAAIEALITDYFRYLGAGSYEKAWELTSDRSKQSYPKSEALNSHFGLDKVKLIKIEKSNLPHPTNYLSGILTLYVVTLDVVPGSISSWEEGVTQRFVNVVRDSSGNWKIDGLPTGP